MSDIQAAADRLDELRRIGAAAPSHSKCGVLISTPLDGGPEIVTDLVRCGHCDYTWPFVPGSGRRRGFCMRCGHILCGRTGCMHLSCTHLEQRLDNLESGRSLDFHPVIVSVPAAPPA